MANDDFEEDPAWRAEQERRAEEEYDRDRDEQLAQQDEAEHRGER